LALLVSRNTDERKELGNKFMRIGLITDPPVVVHSCAIVGGQLARQLARLGHEVHLLGYNYRGDAISHCDGYAIHPDIPQPPTGRLSVEHFIKKTGVQIVYAHGCPGIFGGAIAACMACKVPFISHTFFQTPGLAPSPSPGRTGQDPGFGDISGVDEFIACNGYSLGFGLSRGKRVWYLPNGVDTSLFRPSGSNYRDALGPGPNDFVVLFSGTNNWIKDPVRALSAFYLFQEGKPDAYLAMHTRPESTHANLRTMARELNISKKVLFFTDAFPRWLDEPWNDAYPRNPGSPAYTTTPYQQMPAIYRTGDVQIVTSNMEGMSTTILEGMACGLPTICSDDPVVAEPIVPCQTGILISREPLNSPKVDLLASAMERLYQDRTELKRMGDNAAQLARLRHDWFYIAKRLVEIFEDILHRNR
jgi:glycosyltransferase involved in cell wall biosynthesis